MTEQDRNALIDELRREYRAIQAPPYLATRIRASVNLSKGRGWRWRTAVVGVLAVIALIVAVPLSRQDLAPPTASSGYPSLTAIGGSLPLKPTAPIPSLADIGSVSMPRMPALPPMPTPGQPTG